MSDNAPFQLYVHNCPTDSVDAVIAIINRHRLSEDWDWRGPEVDELRIGTCYGVEDARLDESREIVDELIAAAPEITFQAWQDPKWEWTGETYLFAPNLGLFTAECDQFGRPTLTLARLRGMVEALPNSISKAEVIESLERLGGEAWFDAFRHLRGPGASIPGEG